MDEELDWDDVTMEEVQQVLALNALKINRLMKKNEELTERLYQMEKIRDDYKRQAGYSADASFDDVWKEVLEKAERYDDLDR